MESKRTVDIGERSATLLKSKNLRVLVDDKGAMVPELSVFCQGGWINAHWNPRFRGIPGGGFSKNQTADFWGVELLYEIAGNFPCLPNFGGPCSVTEGELPAHGHTANKLWNFEFLKEEGLFTIAKSTLEGCGFGNLSYIKYDIIHGDHPIHYTVIKVINSGRATHSVNAAWHNTVGPPFLESGCLVDLSAQKFAVPPKGGEFDETGRLKIAANFDNLNEAPLRNGSTADLRKVEGPIGYSDFITGALYKGDTLGWSAVVNPRLRLLYLPFYKGAEVAGEDEFTLNFNMLWMQYGGRSYTPWANTEGGTDYEFCLGVEQGTGAYANGLAYSRQNDTVLGRPTTVTIKGNETKTLYYGTLFAPFDEGTLESGVSAVTAQEGSLRVSSYDGSHEMNFKADSCFKEIAKVIEMAG